MDSPVRRAATEEGEGVTSLLSIDDIAKMLGVEYRHVRDRLSKRPDFPRPALNLSQKTRRWDRAKVQEWVEAHAKKNAR